MLKDNRENRQVVSVLTSPSRDIPFKHLGLVSGRACKVSVSTLKDRSRGLGLRH